MWNRKELKKSGKKAMRANYWQCVIVSLLVLVLVGGLNFSRPLQQTADITTLNYKGASNTQIVNEVAHSVFDERSAFWDAFGDISDASAGALASIFNNATASGSFLFGLLNAVNQLFFNDSVLPGIIIAIGAGITFLFYVFVKNILRVGEYRFYLENRRYTETKVNRLLYVYKIRRIRKVALVMLLRAVYTILWFFTIVGGFIKIYSYRLVPLIIAENPDIPAKEAIRLSRSMMNGNKWQCFLLDLTFLGWYLLSYLTFHILGIFYVNPYYTTTCTELYFKLREKALADDPALAAAFNDPCLTPAAAEEAPYPTKCFPIPEAEGRRWLTVDYHRRYSFLDLVLLFFTFCLIGYVWEVFYYLIETGTFINRGTMYGPWLPIYGCGGVAVLLLLHRLVDRPVLVFFLVVVICGTIEYFTSWFLDVFKDTKWWDYTGYFLNINGRVCLEGLLVFGFAGTIGIYLLAPVLDNQFERIPKKVRIVLCIVLAAAFLTDLAYSSVHPNMAAGVAA